MKNIGADDFNAVTGKGSVIVDFWAEWCGPCKMIGPIYEELSNEMENITFAKLNVDEHPEVAANAGVRGIPTMVLYKDGDEVGRIVGFLPKDALKKKIEDAFA